MPAPSLPLRAQLAEALSLDNSRLFYVILALSIVPLWIGRYLPLVDLPQHAAQIAALRLLWSGDEVLAVLLQVNWFTPYLLGYLLLYALALVLPIAVATKLIVSVAVVAVPLLTGRLLRVAGADERWKWLAIPCSFGFAFYWGFLSFIVAAPLGLVFLIRTIGFVREPSVRRGAGIALLAVFLFFCHVIVLGFASLVALGYVVGTHYRNLKTLLLHALPFTAPLPLIGVWLAVTYESESRVQSHPVIFGPLSHRFVQLLTQSAGREDFSPSSAPIVLLVAAAVLLLPWLSGARFSRQPRRWMPFALGSLVFMVAPHYVLSTAFFYQRLGLFLVPLWLMAWDRPQRGRKVEWLAVPIVVLWVAMSIGRFAAFARETESFTALLDRVERGHRVAAMVDDSGSPLFASPVYLHFPAWYQALGRGLVDYSFSDFYSSMARYRGGTGPRIGEYTSWYPQAFRWDADGGISYEYFIVKSNHDVSAEIFKEKLASVELVARSEWWWLYRNVERAGLTR